jgi:hypothetical protein
MTLNLDHLVVPPSEQRARHRAFRQRMWPQQENPAIVEIPAPPAPDPSLPRRIDIAIDEYEWLKANTHEQTGLMLRRAVAGAFGFTIRGLMGAERHGPIVEARHVLMVLCRHYGLSLEHIARIVHRDHSTVYHGILKMGPIVEAVIAARAPDGRGRT